MVVISGGLFCRRCSGCRRSLSVAGEFPVAFGEEEGCFVTSALCPLFRIRISIAQVKLFLWRNGIFEFQFGPGPTHLKSSPN